MNTKLTPQQSSAITLVRQEAKHLGITLPAEAAATPAPLHLSKPGADEISAAVTKALTAGKDPGEDKAVQALVTRAYLADLPGVIDALEAKRDQATLDAFTDALPWINHQLSDLFDADAETLVKHRATLAGVTLANLDPLNLPLHAGKAAVEVIDATKRMDKVLGVWRIIHHVLTQAWQNPYAKTLQISDPTYEQWQDNHLHEKDNNPSPWDLVRMGVKLSLAENPEQVAARYQSLEQAGRQHDAEADEYAQFGHGGRAAHIAANRLALANLNR